MFSQSFTDILIRSLYDASTIPSTVQKKENLNSGLCDCKTKILNSYFKNIIGLLVEVNAIAYESMYRSDEKHVIERYEHVKNIFKYLYTTLYSEHCLSSKMVLLFEQLQSSIDDQMMDSIKQFLFYLSESDDEEGKERIYRGLHENILNWSELAVFNLTGLNIDCSNINDAILDGKDITNPQYCCVTNPCTRIHDCKGCKLHKQVEEEKETLRIFVIEEYSIIPNWYENYFNLFKTYHKNPGNINLILDYRLCKSDICHDHHISCPARLREISGFFKGVTITNHVKPESCPNNCPSKDHCLI